jgi:hypothetical protein
MYKSFTLKFLGIVAAALVVIAGLSVYSDWRGRKNVENAAEALKRFEKEEYERAMADTYGGKTPQETLDMFVDALRKGDVELASKYFMLDDNLSREKWVDYLANIKQKGLLVIMADDVAQEARPLGSSREGAFAFALFNKDGTVGVQILMQFNKYSQVWKIESL